MSGLCVICSSPLLRFEIVRVTNARRRHRWLFERKNKKEVKWLYRVLNWSPTPRRVVILVSWQQNLLQHFKVTAAAPTRVLPNIQKSARAHLRTFFSLLKNRHLNCGYSNCHLKCRRYVLMAFEAADPLNRATLTRLSPPCLFIDVPRKEIAKNEQIF